MGTGSRRRARGRGRRRGPGRSRSSDRPGHDVEAGAGRVLDHQRPDGDRVRHLRRPHRHPAAAQRPRLAAHRRRHRARHRGPGHPAGHLAARHRRLHDCAAAHRDGRELLMAVLHRAVPALVTAVVPGRTSGEPTMAVADLGGGGHRADVRAGDGCRGGALGAGAAVRLPPAALLRQPRGTLDRVRAAGAARARGGGRRAHRPLPPRGRAASPAAALAAARDDPGGRCRGAVVLRGGHARGGAAGHPTGPGRHRDCRAALPASRHPARGVTDRVLGAVVVDGPAGLRRPRRRPRRVRLGDRGPLGRGDDPGGARCRATVAATATNRRPVDVRRARQPGARGLRGRRASGRRRRTGPGGVAAAFRSALRLPYVGIRVGSVVVAEDGEVGDLVGEVPLDHGSRVEGTLVIGLRRGERQLSTQDRDALRLVSGTVGGRTARDGPLRAAAGLPRPAGRRARGGAPAPPPRPARRSRTRR